MGRPREVDGATLVHLYNHISQQGQRPALPKAHEEVFLLQGLVVAVQSLGEEPKRSSPSFSGPGVGRGHLGGNGQRRHLYICLRKALHRLWRREPRRRRLDAAVDGPT
eukprot:scaffold1260_cov254-Pinguiococcus_pyrenoidosus.AAC.4